MCVQTSSCVLSNLSQAVEANLQADVVASYDVPSISRPDKYGQVYSANMAHCLLHSEFKFACECLASKEQS